MFTPSEHSRCIPKQSPFLFCSTGILCPQKPFFRVEGTHQGPLSMGKMTGRGRVECLCQGQDQPLLSVGEGHKHRGVSSLGARRCPERSLIQTQNGAFRTCHVALTVIAVLVIQKATHTIRHEQILAKATLTWLQASSSSFLSISALHGT